MLVVLSYLKAWILHNIDKLLEYRPTSISSPKNTYQEITYHTISLKEITHHTFSKERYKSIYLTDFLKIEDKTIYLSSFLKETNYIITSIKKELNTTYLASSLFFLTTIGMIIILFIMLV